MPTHAFKDSSSIDSHIMVDNGKIVFKSYMKITSGYPALDDFPPWPSVSVKEVRSLINQLKRASGFDNFSLELFKDNINWQASFLASLFTYFDTSNHIPGYWSQVIIVPFFMKGKRDDPANSRPINLLSITGKLHASHLFGKLKAESKRKI